MGNRLQRLLVLFILPSSLVLCYFIISQGLETGEVGMKAVEDYFSFYTEPYYNMRFMAALSVASTRGNAAVEELNSAMENFNSGNIAMASKNIENAQFYISEFEKALPKVEEEVYNKESRLAYNSLKGMLEAQKDMLFYLKEGLDKAALGEDYNEEMNMYNRAAMRYDAHARALFEFQKKTTGVVAAG